MRYQQITHGTFSTRYKPLHITYIVQGSQPFRYKLGAVAVGSRTVNTGLSSGVVHAGGLNGHVVNVIGSERATCTATGHSCTNSTVVVSHSSTVVGTSSAITSGVRQTNRSTGTTAGVTATTGTGGA